MALMQADELREFSKHVLPRLAKDGPAALQHLSRSPNEILDAFLRVCDEPHLTTAHKAAAYDALAGFISKGAASDSDLKALCVGADTFQRCLGIYISRYDGCSTKSMRLLLTTLVKVLGLQEESTSHAQTLETARRCLVPILDHEDPSGVKPALLALDVLLAKGRILPKDFLVVVNQLEQDDSAVRAEQVSTEQLLRVAQLFIMNVLEWTNLNHVAPSAGTLLETFCKVSRDLFRDQPAAPSPLWFPSIRKIQEKGDEYVEMLERHVLPGLIRLSSVEVVSELAPVLQALQSRDVASLPENELRFCLLVLKCGKPAFKSQKMHALQGTSVNVQDLSDPIPVETILLTHSSSTIRLSALELLVSAYQLPDHLPKLVLESILQQLPVFHAETDAQARNVFTSNVRKLFSRIYISVFRLQQDLAENESGRSSASKQRNQLDQDQDALQTQLNFLTQYFHYLIAELRPSSAYQRHITALRVLKKLFDSDLSEHAEFLPRDTDLTDSLLVLAMNGFDDIRAGATGLLKHSRMLKCLQSPEVTHSLSSKLHRAVLRSKEMLEASGRADFADGFGRLQDFCFELADAPYQCFEELLKSLEAGLLVARRNLNQAVSAAPIHGELIALRYIISRPDIRRAFSQDISWDQCQSRLMSIFTLVWEIVRPVLCEDSPEGRSFIEEEGEVDIGIKDTLSYSWRALKETSSVMQALVSNDAYSKASPSGRVEFVDLEVMGRLAFVQLAELRHRGAFSAVAHAFTACCTTCRKSSDSSTQALPDAWYQETLLCIHEKANALTRRSAGLPSMIIGNLISTSADSFKTSLLELQAVARQPSTEVLGATGNRLPQVHALNCLKDVCTNNQLGPATDPYLSDIILLTMDCLESEIWAIRNCGIMLFKALLNRLTPGSNAEALRQTDRHQKYAKATFERFPSLSQLLIRLLERSMEVEDPDGLGLKRELGFPAIQMIDRVGVLPKDRQAVILLLSHHLNSPLWIVRENTARALSSLMSTSEPTMLIKDLLAQEKKLPNRLHGLLLCLEFGLSHTTSGRSKPGYLLLQLIDCYELMLVSQVPPFTLASYLRCVTLLAGYCWDPRNSKETLAQESELMKRAKILADSLRSHEPSYADVALMESIVAARVALSFLHDRGGDGPATGLELLLQYSSKGWPISPGFVTFPPPSPDMSADSLMPVLKFTERMLSPWYHDGAEASLSYLCLSLDVFDDRRLSHSESERLRGMLLKILDLLDKAQVQDEDMVIAQMVARGALLPRLLALEEHASAQVISSLTCWSRALHTALAERADFSTRIAAVSSIWQFRRALRLQHETASTTKVNMFNIFRALANALVDDDDEVREEAARTISYVISSRSVNPDFPHQTLRLNPVAARSILTEEILIKQFSSLPEAVETGLGSILGLAVRCTWVQSLDHHNAVTAISPSRSAETAVEEGLKPITSLFLEERQNLFVDELQEAEEWARVLASVPLGMISEQALAGFGKWLHGGLSALTEHATKHTDGVLGWSSSRDAHIAGMRLLLAVEVQLTWSRALGVKSEALLGAVQTLKEGGEQQQLSGLWIKRMERMLAK